MKQIIRTGGGGIFSHFMILMEYLMRRDNIMSIDTANMIIDGKQLDSFYNPREVPYFSIRPVTAIGGATSFMSLSHHNFFDSILDQEPIPFQDQKNPQGPYTNLHVMYYEDLATYMKLARETSKQIKFKPELIEKANLFYENNFNNSTNVLGIHLRMTDVNTVSKLREDSDNNLSKEGKIKLFKDYNSEVFKKYKELIRRALSENPEVEYIYVATDNREDALLLQKEFSNENQKLIWRDSKYLNESSNDISSKEFQGGGVNSLQAAFRDPLFYQDAVLDLLILMKSKYLLGRLSSVNWFSQICHLSNYKKYYHLWLHQAENLVLPENRSHVYLFNNGVVEWPKDKERHPIRNLPLKNNV
jgi:hypothetical protein